MLLGRKIITNKQIAVTAHGRKELPAQLSFKMVHSNRLKLWDGVSRCGVCWAAADPDISAWGRLVAGVPRAGRLIGLHTRQSSSRRSQTADSSAATVSKITRKKPRLIYALKKKDGILTALWRIYGYVTTSSRGLLSIGPAVATLLHLEHTHSKPRIHSSPSKSGSAWIPAREVIGSNLG